MNAPLADLHQAAVDTLIASRHIVLRVARLAEHIAASLPAGHAVIVIAPLAAALTASAECALELDAIALSLAGLLDSAAPPWSPGAEAAQALAMRELIEATGVRIDTPPTAAPQAEPSSGPPSTHPPSCCIICHRSGDELMAHGIGWAQPGLCIQCGRPDPIEREQAA